MEKKISIFKNKNFSLTFFGALVSNVASMFYSFAASFYILKFSDNSALLQGVFLGMCGIVFLIADLFGGVIADRFNKAKIMYLTDLIKGIVSIVLALLFLVFDESNSIKIILLFILGFLSNVISGIFTPASSAILPYIVSEDRLQEANSYFSIMRSFQSIVGAILAAILFSLLNIFALLICVGVLYVISGITEIFIKYEQNESETKMSIKTVFKDIAEGAKYLYNTKALLSIVVVCLFVNFFFNPPFSVMLPYFVETDLSLAESYLLDNILKPESFSSVVGIGQALGMILVGIIISHKDFTGKFHKCYVLGLVGCTFCLLAITLSYYFCIEKYDSINGMLIAFFGTSFVVGSLCCYINVPFGTTIQRITDKKMLGKVTSCIDIGTQAFVPLSSFIGGILIQYAGCLGLLIFCTAGFAITALASAFNKSSRSL